MRFLSTFSFGLFLFGQNVVADESYPPCVLVANELLSICANIEGLDVSFVDATPTSAMGIVRLNARHDIYYIWQVYREPNTSLANFSRTQTNEFAKYLPDYDVAEPVTTTVQGFPGIRYDLRPVVERETEVPPGLILFLEISEGFVIFHSQASTPDVEVDDIHSGVMSAARVVKDGD